MENVIEIRNTNIFQEDNLILSDVNLDIAKGEFVYLVGRVGSGKTSLIKTITAEIPLKFGRSNRLQF
jgi:cell division transport system ATP-binding protein